MSTDIVFIVGMPRSGTKLLRDLLNRHDDVKIFPNETHFFPVLKRRLAEYGNLADRSNFARLHRDLQRTVFFRRMAERGIVFDVDHWHRSMHGDDFGAVLNGLFSCYRDLTGSRIVGDKSPSYVTHLGLLGEALPEAKFIHIVRDPRDQALSTREAWGKNVLRAAARWKNGIRKCRQDAKRTGVSYMELTYETLLQDPRETLSRLCQFIGVPFSESMLSLAQPSESLGNARGASHIVQNNFSRWRNQLSEQDVRSIESVAGALMVELGYLPKFAPGDRDLSQFEELVTRLADSVGLLRYSIREQGGVIRASRHLWRVLRYRPGDDV